MSLGTVPSYHEEVPEGHRIRTGSSHARTHSDRHSVRDSDGGSTVRGIECSSMRDNCLESAYANHSLGQAQAPPLLPHIIPRLEASVVIVDAVAVDMAAMVVHMAATMVAHAVVG